MSETFESYYGEEGYHYSDKDRINAILQKKVETIVKQISQEMMRGYIQQRPIYMLKNKPYFFYSALKIIFPLKK